MKWLQFFSFFVESFKTKICFLPLTAPVNEKIGTTDVVRYLEDEGLYVGERPVMPRSAINKMENRLVQEKNKVFFTTFQKIQELYLR